MRIIEEIKNTIRARKFEKQLLSITNGNRQEILIEFLNNNVWYFIDLKEDLQNKRDDYKELFLHILNDDIGMIILGKEIRELENDVFKVEWLIKNLEYRKEQQDKEIERLDEEERKEIEREERVNNLVEEYFRQ